MSPEAQRIAIAEALPVVAESRDGEFYYWKDSGQPFDPLTDLNASREMLSVFDNRAPLTRHQWWQRYFGQLSVVLGVPYDFMPQFTTEHAIKYHNATAAQRAEAFLRTIGKWQD